MKIIKCLLNIHTFEDFPNKEYLDYKDKCCIVCGKMELADRSIENIPKLELSNKENPFEGCTSLITLNFPNIRQF